MQEQPALHGTGPLLFRIERFEKNEGTERFTNAIEDHRNWNAWKKEHALWAYESSKCAAQEAFRDLDKAFKNFWEGRKEGRSVGFPKFKKKGLSDHFRLTGSIHVHPHHIQLPRLGLIRLKEKTCVIGKILSATVKKESDRWFVCICVEQDRIDPEPIVGETVGIDLGLTTFAVLSNAETIHSPKPLKKNLKKLKRLSKQHACKQKGSENQRKSAIKLSKHHFCIRNQRQDFLHKATTRLAKTKSVIVVEDLSVKKMLLNKNLSRSIADAGWGEFYRMLKYKTEWYGSKFLVAPEFFPSSKMCSACGHIIRNLPLSIREWQCPHCQTHHDRDKNAAINLQNYSTASSAGIYACGDSSGSGTAKTGLRVMSLGSRK